METLEVTLGKVHSSLLFVDTLADTLAELETETVSDTLGVLEVKAMVDKKADKQSVVEVKTLGTHWTV